MFQKILEKLAEHGLIDSVDAVRHNAVSAAQNIAATRAKLQAEARARQEALEEEEEEGEEEEGEEGEEGEEEARQGEKGEEGRHGSARVEHVVDEAAAASSGNDESHLVAAPRADDDDDGPKVEVLDE